MIHRLRSSLFYLLFLSGLSVSSYAEMPVSSDNMQQLYQESMRAIDSNQWDEALQKLRLLNIRYVNNPYMEEAKVWIIFCYANKKDFKNALPLINSFVLQHSQSEWREKVLEIKAQLENTVVPLSVWGYTWRILVGVIVVKTALFFLFD